MRRKSFHPTTIVRRAAPLLLLLAACSGSRSSPEGAVSTFLETLEARDTVAFAASFTPGTRELVQQLEELTREVGAATDQPAITIEDWCRAFCGGIVEGSTLDSDSATVRVRVGTAVEEMPLVRVGDEWLIDLEERYRPAVEMLRMIDQQPTDTTAP